MLEIDSYIDTVLETSNLAEVFDIIYNSGGCVEAFHKKQGSRNLSVSTWDDGARSLCYSVTVPVPVAVSSITGEDLDIEESQRVTWVSIGGSTIPDPLESTSTGLSSVASSASDLLNEPPIGFNVTCVPKLKTCGDRFTTELTFSFRKRAAGLGGGVRVVCSFKVEAKVWGLQSTIEPLMMSEAKKNLSEFFPFMAEFFHMRGGVAMVPASMLSTEDDTAASNLSTMTTLNPEECSSFVTDADVFFDAEESVPKGVRAAVQLFEGGQVAAKRPVIRSRSPSPSSKISRLRIPSVLETGASSNPTPSSDHKSPLGLLRTGLLSRWQPSSEGYDDVHDQVYDDPHSFRQRRYSTPAGRSTRETFARTRTHQNSARVSSTASAFDAGDDSPCEAAGSEVGSCEDPALMLSARQSEPCLLHHCSCQTEPLMTHRSEPEILHNEVAKGSFEECTTAYESVAEDSIGTMTTITQDERLRVSMDLVHTKLGAAEQRIEELSARLEECVSHVHRNRGASDCEHSPRKFSSPYVSAGFVLGVAVGVGAVLGMIWGRQQGMSVMRQG